MDNERRYEEALVRIQAVCAASRRIERVWELACEALDPSRPAPPIPDMDSQAKIKPPKA